MVSEPIEQCRNAGGVGKDGIPVLEGTIGGDQNRAAFIAAIDDLVKQIGGGAKQNAVAGGDGGVGDVLGKECFTEAIGSDQNEIARLGDEIESQSAFDQIAVDFGGPAPVEIGERLKAADARL